MVPMEYAIHNTHARRAAELVGGISALARHLGVTNNTIYAWRDKIPAERCAAIEKATGGRITRQEMRPDLWPEPAPARPSAPETAGSDTFQ